MGKDDSCHSDITTKCKLATLNAITVRYAQASHVTHYKNAFNDREEKLLEIIG